MRLKKMTGNAAILLVLVISPLASFASSCDYSILKIINTGNSNNLEADVVMLLGTSCSGKSGLLSIGKQLELPICSNSGSKGDAVVRVAIYNRDVKNKDNQIQRYYSIEYKRPVKGSSHCNVKIHDLAYGFAKYEYSANSTVNDKKSKASAVFKVY